MQRKEQKKRREKRMKKNEKIQKLKKKKKNKACKVENPQRAPWQKLEPKKERLIPEYTLTPELREA